MKRKAENGDVSTKVRGRSLSAEGRKCLYLHRERGEFSGGDRINRKKAGGEEYFTITKTLFQDRGGESSSTALPVCRGREGRDFHHFEKGGFHRMTRGKAIRRGGKRSCNFAKLKGRRSS